MSRICLSGNAGFLGSHLADALIEQGHEVYGLDNLSGGFVRNVHKDCKFFTFDCASKEARTLVENVKPEILLYCAADATEGRSAFTPISATQNNLYAYVNVLTAAIKGGVKRVVTFSSMSVYGNQEPPFSEDLPRKPVDIYGVNKAAMEQITEILASVHGFEYVIIRPHNVFGSRQCLESPYRNVIAIWMNRIMQGKPPIIYGDGEQRRAFTYVDNFTPYCIKACFQDNCNGEIINIGPTRDYSINEACRIILEAMGSDLKPIYEKDRPLEVKHAYTTARKAEELLGYKTTVSLEEGVKRMAKWAKELGPQEFKYLDDLEIENEKTPIPWSKKTM